MGIPCLLLFSTRSQAFQAILAQHLEEIQARFILPMCRLAQQAFIDERCHAVQDRDRHAPKRGRDSLYGLQRAPSGEDRKSAKERLLIWREQVIVPPQCVAQRLLAERGIQSPSSQHF